MDGVLASFWLSTGLFPQTLTIRLQRPVAVYEVIQAEAVFAAYGAYCGSRYLSNYPLVGSPFKRGWEP